MQSSMLPPDNNLFPLPVIAMVNQMLSISSEVMQMLFIYVRDLSKLF
jgi:hypothetical protein